MDATSPPALPDNIIEEILLRLRVKELIRLRCLSKQWKSRIESRIFIVRFPLGPPITHLDAAYLYPFGKAGLQVFSRVLQVCFYFMFSSILESSLCSTYI